MKKIISFLLVLGMVLNMAVYVCAEDTEDTSDYHVIEYSFDNLKMNMRSDLKGKFSNDENGAIKTDGIEGSFIEGKINVEQDGVYSVYANMIFLGTGGNIQLSVNGEDVGERVSTSGNGNSREIEFGAIYMERGENTVRFTAKKGNSYAIGIKGVRVRKQAVTIKATCNKTGNCFVEGEEVVFDVSFANQSSKTLNTIVEPEAESSFGTVYENEPMNLDIQPYSTANKQIKLNIQEKNTYTFRINLKIESEKEMQTYEVPFTYVEKAKEYDGDSIFAVCINMGNLSGKNLTDECDMLAKTGIQYGRDNLYWSIVETEQGKYNFYGDAFIDALIERGIKPLICLGYGNKYYMSSGDVPGNEAEYEAFGKYAAAIAEHYKGNIAALEVWNEWNGGAGAWSNGGTNEIYVELLKHAYKSVKEVDPDVPILCGGAITVAYDFFTLLYKLGALDYCDGISYHPYNYPTDPDQKAYQGNVEDNFEESYQIMKQYGTPKPQWYTEWGWYTGTDGGNVDEKTQAEYMVRGYASGMAYGVEKIFYYTFKDVGDQLGYSEHNYGLIKNSTDSAEVKYAPKQSFVAVTAAGNKLKGAKFVKEYRPLPDARVFQYERDGKDVIVMYYVKENATTNTSVKAKVTGDTAQMQMYDMFGNEIDGIDILDGSPVYIEGEKGQFDIEDICLSKRNSVLATFGYWRTQDGIYAAEHYQNEKKNKEGYWGEGCITIGKGYEFDNILCDVDDAYICGGVNACAFDVRFFDEGSGEFYIEYAASNGVIKSTEPILLTNTGDWKTVRIWLDDAAFDNTLDGKDFRVKLKDPTKDAISFYGFRIEKTEDISKRTASISFDDDEQLENLSNPQTEMYYPVTGDGCTAYLADVRYPYEYTERDGRKGIRPSAQGEALFTIVDVDDDILYGNFYPVKVSVDYFDEGTGSFAVAYDVGSYIEFGESQSVKMTGTKTWKTAEFVLDNCWWQNHENKLSDISVQLWAPQMDRSPEGVVIGKISFEVLDDAPEKEKTAVSFSDIDGHWAQQYLTDMAEEGAMNGYEDGTMRPDNNITVNEFVALVMRKLKYRGISEGTSWADGYVNRAKELGIIQDGEFDNYDRSITRGEIARILSRITGKYSDSKTFVPNDFDTISDDMKPYVAGVYRANIMTGDDNGIFGADRNATRAEMAAILSRI